MELRRADIGFGTVIVDDRGVERRGLIWTRSITWDAIDEYRLGIEPRTAPLDSYRHGSTPLGEILHAVDSLRGKNAVYHLDLELIGRDARVAFGWRFHDVHLAISEVLARIHDRLAARARASTPAMFGPLALSADEVQWRGARIERAEVERIELFDSSPVTLRVLALGKVLPFARASMAEVPNVLVALELAHELGYATGGGELARAALSTPNRDVMHQG